MTEKELKLKEKLIPHYKNINNILFPKLIELLQTQKMYYDDYIHKSFSFILNPVKKLLNPLEYYASYEKTRSQVNIFKINSNKDDELICTIFIQNFPYNLSLSQPTTSQIKIQNFNPVNNFHLEEEKISRYELLAKVNKYFLNNQDKIIAKVHSLFKSHQKKDKKLFKKVQIQNKKLDISKEKLLNVYYPYLLKDLKEDFIIFKAPQTLNFPKSPLKNVAKIKLLNKDTFLAIISEEPLTGEEWAGDYSSIPIQVPNPSEFIKANILPKVINWVVFPSLYTELTNYFLYSPTSH